MATNSADKWIEKLIALCGDMPAGSVPETRIARLIALDCDDVGEVMTYLTTLREKARRK